MGTLKTIEYIEGIIWEILHSTIELCSLVTSNRTNTKSWFTWGPKFLCLKSLQVNLCNLSCWEHGSWDLPTHTWSQVPSMTWKSTWQHFLEVRLGTCIESWSSKKPDPTLNTSPVNIFAWNKQDPILMMINHIFMLFGGSKVETLPPMLGLTNMSGTSDFGPHVNQP